MNDKFESFLSDALAQQKALDLGSQLHDDAMALLNQESVAAMDAREWAERNSAVLALAELEKSFAPLHVRDDLTRIVLGPTEDLRAFHAASLRISETFEVLRRSAESYERRFRLPDTLEIDHLLKFNSEISELARQFMQHDSGLIKAIEAMRSPWLDMTKEISSIQGFAALQGIGKVVNQFSGFDDVLADPLRVELGDWRDEIVFPKNVFDDIAARSDFYVGRGFNARLTDFPAPAFLEGLAIAHLRADFAAAIPEYFSGEQSENAVRGAETRFRRNNQAYDQLQRIETHLRRLIDVRMTAQFGPEWPRTRLPNKLYDDWKEKKQKAERNGDPVHPLVAYADFTDYERIILKKDNWSVFAPIFRRQESLRESLQRLYPLRIATMHSRLISHDDQLFLIVEIKRLMNAIGGDP